MSFRITRWLREYNYWRPRLVVVVAATLGLSQVFNPIAMLVGCALLAVVGHTERRWPTSRDGR